MNSNMNIQWISKLLLFFFEVYFEGGARKTYTNKLKDICNGVHFSDKIAGGGSVTLPKNAQFLLRFVVFYKEFLKILTNFCFPENLLVATFSGRRLRSEKT